MTEFQARVLEIAPFAELEQDARTWRDAIVFVRAGVVDVTCANGERERFGCGDILCLAPFTVRTVRNPVDEVARLLLVARRPVSATATSRHTEDRRTFELEETGTMTNQDFTATFSVAQPADVVFAAINDPRRWWGEGIEGNSVAVGDQFIHRVEGAHWAKLEVAELVPNELVVWRVLENRFDFVEDQTEWVGTTITFELTPTAAGTEVSFMHEGLTPQDECYEVCATAWSSLMHGSLPRLIEAGAGDPYPRVFEEHRV